MAESERPPSMLEESHAFWRENTRALIKESIQALEETAKQAVGVAGILEGLYFHAITYADLRGQVNVGEALVYLLPLACWAISVLLGLAVFFPRTYETNISSWRQGKVTFEHVVAYKHRMLKLSGVFLGLGGVALFVALALYLAG